MEKKKRLLIILAPILVITAAILLALFMSISRRPVLVQFISGEYARGNGVHILFDRALLGLDRERFTGEKDAMAYEPLRPEWGLWSLANIKMIRFLPVEKEEPAALDGQYTGTWSINAEGNPGYMFIVLDNGRYTGTIRFPRYALGQVEVMHNLSIEGRKITFVRSAATSAELRRLGVSTPFRQEYTGWFNPAGTFVRGQYAIPGSIRNWSGYRMRGKK